MVETVVTIENYQFLAMRTKSRVQGPVLNLQNAVFGLVGETGELADLFKKHKFHGHEFDKDKFANELGDCCWYVALLCATAGPELDSIRLFPRVGVRWDMITLGKSLLCTSQCVGSLASLINQGTYGGEQLQVKPYRDNLKVLWNEYVFLANFCGGLDAVLQRNISKLMLRYPEGFSFNKSINRVEQ